MVTQGTSGSGPKNDTDDPDTYLLKSAPSDNGRWMLSYDPAGGSDGKECVAYRMPESARQFQYRRPSSLADALAGSLGYFTHSPAGDLNNLNSLHNP